MVEKAAGAFRTIGELADDLGLPQHILRYWETRFSQLKPLTRAGNRRYYRPDDVVLAKRIHHLLSVEGYTVKGVQKLLAAKDSAPAHGAVVAAPSFAPTPDAAQAVTPNIGATLSQIRDRLAAALASA
jgi:DNA-binding transcriptional MerR regulator